MFTFTDKEKKFYEYELQYGDILSCCFYRPLAIIFVRGIKKILTPNMVTVLSLLFGVSSAYFFMTGEYKSILIGVLLIQISFFLDVVDGTLANLTGRTSVYGKWLDGLVDTINHLAIAISFTIGAYVQTQSIFCWFVLIGFFAILILSGNIQSNFVSDFKEEFTPINDDMFSKLVKIIPLLKYIPKAFVKNPIGATLYTTLFTIFGILNMLLLPMIVYGLIHVLNSIKTIVYTTIKYRKI